MTEVIKTRVSLVLNVIDQFTGDRAFGQIAVSVKNKNPRIVKNLSGYYVFLNMDPGIYELRVKSRYYFTKFFSVDLTSLDPKQPVVTIVLVPCPAYPFPPGTTLIRGHVTGTGGEMLPGVTVYLAGKIKDARQTDKQGEFVLYFKNLTQDDIKRINDKYYIKGAGPNETRLFVKAESGLASGRAVIEQLREGTAFSIEPPIQLVIETGNTEE